GQRRGRRPLGDRHGPGPPRLEEALQPVLGDPERDSGNSQSGTAGGDRGRAEADDAASSVWHTDRHWHDRLLCLDWDACMSWKTCQPAVTNLLSRAWKLGASGMSLSPTEDKLERPCRLYRRNRRAAAAVEFAVVAPVFFLLVFGMIEYGRMVMVQQVITN